jgi:hypothetical protein
MTGPDTKFLINGHVLKNAPQKAFLATSGKRILNALKNEGIVVHS